MNVIVTLLVDLELRNITCTRQVLLNIAPKPRLKPITTIHNSACTKIKKQNCFVKSRFMLKHCNIFGIISKRPYDYCLVVLST